MPRYLFQGSYSREGTQGLLPASLIVAASGAGHWRTTVLLSAEEMDQATRTGGGYLAPGA